MLDYILQWISLYFKGKISHYVNKNWFEIFFIFKCYLGTVLYKLLMIQFAASMVQI